MRLAESWLALLFILFLSGCSQESSDVKLTEENNRGIIELAKILALESGGILSEDWGVAVKSKLGPSSPSFAFISKHLNEEEFFPILKKIENFFHGTKYEFWIDSSNTHLINKLSEIGYVRVSTFPGLAMQLNRQFNSFRPQGVTFSKATTDQEFKDVAFITSQVYKYDSEACYSLIKTIRAKAPHVNFYIAYHEGNPVSSRMMIFHNKTVAGYFSATLPDYRGRGVASNLLSFALLDAKERGITLFTVQAISGPIVWQRFGMKSHNNNYLCFSKRN